MKILILSTSLNPKSRSRIMARKAEEHLQGSEAEICFVDLQEINLPFCGSPNCYEQPEVEELVDRIRESDGILIATPVYNYDVNAACKNLIELTGDAWEGKIVGFACAAGGNSSYMSIMGLANSLMLDFRCLIIPRFVYATGAAFRDGALSDPTIADRVIELSDALVDLAGTRRT